MTAGRTTLSESAMMALREAIRQRAGMVFCESRERDLETGVRRAMTHAGIADIDRFVALVNTDQELFDILMADLTVAETYFFREPAQFEMLRRRILPDLSRSRPPESRLHAWSAGCASGEEPYSLAILLEQEGLAERWTILGTDISRPILTRARKAKYSPWSFRGNDAHLEERYFDRQGGNLTLKERLRQRVAFQYLNLASRHDASSPGGAPAFDLILCRNVLIYFDRLTVAEVAQRLFDSLRDGGWLIMGPSDPPLWDLAPFEVVTADAGVLYRKGGRPVTPRPNAMPALMIPRVFESFTSVAPTRAFASAEANPDELQTEEPIALPQSQATIGNAYDTLIHEIRMRTDRGDAHGAEADLAAALEAYPISAELHYLHALVLMQFGRFEKAVAALRRVIYLDPTLAMAHFTLGAALRRTGADAEARRTYENALKLCNGRPPDEVAPLSDNEPIRTLVAATRTQLNLLPPEAS